MKEVVEFSQFSKRADKEFGERVKEEIVDFLSKTPKAGKKVDNLGGIRRLPLENKTQRGSEFCVYFHPGKRNLPVAIIMLLKKNEKMVHEKLIESLIYPDSF